jgi:hypothetical protein
MEIKENIHELESKLIKGLKEVKERLLKFKKEKKSPLIVSKDGKVVKVDAEDMDEKEIEEDKE